MTLSTSLTGTVAPGATAKPLLLASAGNAVMNGVPALVHVMPSSDQNSWMRKPLAFDPLRYFSTLYEIERPESGAPVLFTSSA